MPCQHAVVVRMLNPLVLPLCSTCEEHESLKTQAVMLTGGEEKQSHPQGYRLCRIDKHFYKLHLVKN